MVLTNLPACIQAIHSTIQRSLLSSHRSYIPSSHLKMQYTKRNRLSMLSLLISRGIILQSLLFSLLPPVYVGADPGPPRPRTIPKDFDGTIIHGPRLAKSFWQAAFHWYPKYDADIFSPRHPGVPTMALEDIGSYFTMLRLSKTCLSEAVRGLGNPEL